MNVNAAEVTPAGQRRYVQLLECQDSATDELTCCWDDRQVSSPEQLDTTVEGCAKYAQLYFVATYPFSMCKQQQDA